MTITRSIKPSIVLAFPLRVLGKGGSGTGSLCIRAPLGKMKMPDLLAVIDQLLEQFSDEYLLASEDQLMALGKRIMLRCSQARSAKSSPRRKPQRSPS